MKTEERKGEPVAVRDDGVRVPRSLVRAAAIGWRLLVVAAAVYLIVYILALLRLVVFPVILALFLSTLLGPPTAWLRSKNWPRAGAAATVMVVGLLVLTAIVAVIVPQVASQADQIGRSVTQGSQQVLEWLAEGPLNISRQQVSSYIEQSSQRLQENSSSLTSGVLAGAVAAVEVVAGLFLTVILTFFFIKDGDQMFEWMASRVSHTRREHVREMGLRAWATMSSYIRGVALVALVDAVLIGIALVVVGVPLVIPLMVLTFFGGFFPVVGAFIAGAVAALVALVSGGFIDALIVVGAATAVQQLEGHILQPVVLGRAVKLHPVVVLLSLTAGGVVAGVPGAFLAIPVAAVATTVGSYVRSIHAPTDARIAS